MSQLFEVYKIYVVLANGQMQTNVKFAGPRQGQRKLIRVVRTKGIQRTIFDQ